MKNGNKLISAKEWRRSQILEGRHNLGLTAQKEQQQHSKLYLAYLKGYIYSESLLESGSIALSSHLVSILRRHAVGGSFGLVWFLRILASRFQTPDQQTSLPDGARQTLGLKSSYIRFCTNI